uniref:LIM zinc-binding domain-containing protein n=1 Tax=Timema cristinae TaxID=61476 RepID=A0A7R9CUJ0_TIMCR|nr:unnamed protein product [Timema cristinae]
MNSRIPSFSPIGKIVSALVRGVRPTPPPAFKLAASTVTSMNPHYHPYTELSSPHSPPPQPPDNNNYHSGHQHHPGPQGPNNPMSNGHVMGPHSGPPNNHHHHPPGPGPHHDHHQHPHHQHPFGGGGPPPGAMHHPHHHHHLNNNNNNNCPTVKVCAGCGGKIIERFLLHALDRYWHNNCLKCSCCGTYLADIGGSCFTKANMILCKTDYIRDKVLKISVEVGCKNHNTTHPSPLDCDLRLDMAITDDKV